MKRFPVQLALVLAAALLCSGCFVWDEIEAGRAIMEAHRTPDGRAATPTVILLTEGFAEAGCFVERPRQLQDWFLEHEHTLEEEELYRQKYAWYDHEKHAAESEDSGESGESNESSLSPPDGPAPAPLAKGSLVHLALAQHYARMRAEQNGEDHQIGLLSGAEVPQQALDPCFQQWSDS